MLSCSFAPFRNGMTLCHEQSRAYRKASRRPYLRQFLPNVFGGDRFNMTRPKSSLTNLQYQKIICADGVLICCDITEKSYVPQELITLNELMDSLKALISMSEDNSSYTTSRPYSPLLKRERTVSEAGLTKLKQTPEQQRRHRSFTNTPTNSPGRTRHSPNKSPSDSPTPNSVLLRMARENSPENELSETEKDSDQTQWYTHETPKTLLCRFRSQMKWFEEKGTDYVAMETLYSLSEILALLTVVVERKSPTALDFRVNDDKSVTISYQLVSSFRQNFMMLKLKSDYCLFLAPF